jgi:hypothetical protein
MKRTINSVRVQFFMLPPSNKVLKNLKPEYGKTDHPSDPAVKGKCRGLELSN